MITNLFKPAWKSDSADKRLEAIASLSDADPEQHKILIELCQDSEDRVALAAVEKLESVDQLIQLIEQQNKPSLGDAVHNRLLHLVQNGAGLANEQILQYCQRVPELRMQLATHAKSSELRQQVVAEMQPQHMLEVLTHTHFTDVRQQIAQQLDAIDDLEQARKLLRGKDKTAERIIKDKIDGIRRKQQQRAEQLAAIKRLVDEAEYLAEHDWLPEFRSRVEANRLQWDAIDFDVPEDSRTRYAQPRAIIDDRLQQQIMVDETRQARDQLLNDLESWLQTLETCDLATALANPPAQGRSRLDGCIVQWEQLQHKAAADEASAQRFKSCIHLLNTALDFIGNITGVSGEQDPADPEPVKAVADQFLHNLGKSQVDRLQTAIKSLHWPTDRTSPVLARSLQQHIDQWHEERRQAQAEQQEKIDKLHKKISSIYRFSRQGNLARARQLSQRVEKALSSFSGKEHGKLEERLKDAQETLQKMDDWKDFATEPKYVELCEAMEKLIGSDLHPDNLSGKIKALQKQWKGLGYSHVSDQYWPRFKDAAEKAYQPCAAFFEERHRARHSNLEKRQQQVEQMRAILDQTDWEDAPDYKSVQAAVRKISDHFANIKDVERGAGQNQWKQFTRLRDAVYQHLEVEYERNIELKHRLVEQMTALAEADPREDNLTTLKALQTRWKQIGITRRTADQKAWKKFKQQGDLVFNRVKALRESERGEMDQQLEGYREIIRDLEQLARKAKDLAEIDHRFGELKTAYTQLPQIPHSVPEKMAQAIQRDYRRACDRVDERHRQLVDGLHRQQLDALRTKAELCSKLEALGPDPDPAALQKLTDQWDAIELHDAELNRRIEARRTAAQGSIDRSEIARQRRLLCIKLEIETGLDSPAEDRELRTQYQLEQMNERGLGHQAINQQDLLQQMEIDWLCMPGADPQQQQAMDARFQRVLRR